MKHKLHKFETNEIRETFEGSNSYEKPYVSLVKEDNTVHYNIGHPYIDLGLPSGTLWARMNVGAENETDYGLYFAWGEIVGYSSLTQTKQFVWGDYQLCDGGNKESSMTKYNSTDGLVALELTDDAVRVAWGGEWRMPTKEQFMELTANTTSEWITNYNNSGVNGRLFTSQNGNYLFFPACGRLYWGSTEDVGRCGYYSTIDLSTESATYYNYLNFRNNVMSIGNNANRCCGQPVRGVIVKQ